MTVTSDWDQPAPDFVQRKMVERIRVNAEGSLAPSLTPDALARTEFCVEALAGRLAVRLRRHMLGVDEEKTVREVRYPADWWQAVKERFAPWWCKRRWPVLFTTHRLEVKSFGAVCPHHDVQSPDPHIEFLMKSPSRPPAASYRVSAGRARPL